MEQKGIRKIMVYVLLIGLSLAFLSPLIWTFMTSLKTPVDAFALPPKWIFVPKWDNYARAWASKDFGRSFSNTVIVGVVSVIVTLLLALPMAYALARFNFKGATVLSIGLILVYMLPDMLVMLPLFVLYNETGLYDTKIGLILAFQIFNLPYSTWLLRGFITQIPKELEEAAAIDGCSGLGILRRIVIPTIFPGLSATAILAFINVFVILLIPLSLSYNKAITVAISIANFKGYGAFNWSLMAAAAIIATAPQLIFFTFVQRYLISGLTLGAMKE